MLSLGPLELILALIELVVVFLDSGPAVPAVIRRQFGEAAGGVWSGIVPFDGDSIWKMGDARQLHRLWNGTGGTSGTW